MKSTNRFRDPSENEGVTHPVSAGVGIAAGITAGAAAGSAVAGPVGTMAGAVIGGVAGGIAGESAAKAIDPDEEDNFWSQNYRTRPYVAEGSDYEMYRPAYRYGLEAESRYQGQSFDAIQSDLERDWEKARDRSTLSWEQARPAVSDAFERTSQLSRRTKKSS